MTGNRSLLLLPGDYVGTEVVAEARRVAEWFGERLSIPFDIDEALIGGSAYDAHQVPVTDETIEKAKQADAVLLGAIDGPKWENVPFDLQPPRGLLRLRKEMGLFANLRPAICFETLTDASTLKPEVVSGLDIMIVRELIGGIYFGEPRGIEDLEDGQRRGFNTQVYTTHEIERIAHVGFDMARKRRGKVTSVDKSNAMEAGRLWREVVQEIHDRDYPDVQLEHMYVDNCAMQLVSAPKQFDVILTDNLFGDILSDEAAMLTGSIGMLPSAALGVAAGGGKSRALYEPVHGSAPDIAGQNIANPIATILSFVMALQYSFDLQKEADLVETAINNVLASGLRTRDIMQDGNTELSTQEMGDAIIAELDKLAQ
jgi:3-isopropylmalate dehydrogenase